MGLLVFGQHVRILFCEKLSFRTTLKKVCLTPFFPQELKWTSLCLRSWSGSVCQSWLNMSQISPPSPPSPFLGSSPSSSVSYPSTVPSAWLTASFSMESKPSSSWVWLCWRPTLLSSLPAQMMDRHLWFSQGRFVCMWKDSEQIWFCFSKFHLKTDWLHC